MGELWVIRGGSQPLTPPPLPLQDTFDIRILMAISVKYTVNFLEAKEGDLHRWVAPGGSC